MVKAEPYTQTIKCNFYYVCEVLCLLQIDLVSVLCKVFVNMCWSYQCLFESVIVVADIVVVVKVYRAADSLDELYKFLQI